MLAQLPKPPPVVVNGYSPALIMLLVNLKLTIFWVTSPPILNMWFGWNAVT